MPAETLLQRLFLDAQEEFLNAIDHIPNPGRGGAIGSLNPASWTIMHVAAVQSWWIREFCADAEADRELGDWRVASYQRRPQDHAPTYPEARARFEQVVEDSTARVMSWSWDDLLAPTTLPAGAPARWRGTSRAYMVARSIAHAYVHAGDLSVVASLMAAGDLGLPGALRHSGPPTARDDQSVPVVAALLRDAFVEVRRVAVTVPTPAVTGAMDRLNPVSHTLAHLLGREDRLWSRVAQGNEPNATLAALHASGEPEPLPWGECLEALDQVEWTVGPWLAGVTPEVGATPMKWRDDSSYGAQIARSATHLFSHAGEMLAHASLYGAGDLGQPGPLAHVGEAVQAAPAGGTTGSGG